MREMEYSNKKGSRGRRPFLIFIKDQKLYLFEGESIPGIVVVKGYDFFKQGKWSHYLYRLVLADGVSAVHGREGWNTGRVMEGISQAGWLPPDSSEWVPLHLKTVDTWGDLNTILKAPMEELFRFITEWLPEEAETLNETEQALSSLKGE